MNVSHEHKDPIALKRETTINHMSEHYSRR